MNTGSLSGIFDEYNSKHKVYHNKHLESSRVIGVPCPVRYAGYVFMKKEGNC